MLHHLTLWWLFLTTYVSAIGISVPPVLLGNKNSHSGLNYLYNCISYPTIIDDVILLHIDSGERTPSQILNLHIFDSDNNQIRYKRDLSGEFDIIFTNLNNPTQFDESNGLLSKKSNIFGKLHLGHSTVVSENKGKSLIYICFDNLYSDKSWSFKPQPKDVLFDIDIKNMTSIKQTNYNKFAKYFQRQKLKKDTTSDFNDYFDEMDFETRMKDVQSNLQESIRNLKQLESMFKKLMDQESKLRDTNESIYSRYTILSLVLIGAICVFGLTQILYFKCYLRKSKVL